MQAGSDRPAVPSPQENRRAPCARETFGRKQRLLSPAQFQEAYGQNRRWHGRHMVLFLRAAPAASLRLGVVASKRVGNAVERARAKRRLREAFRRHRVRFRADAADLVLVARRSLLGAPWSEVVAELLRLAAQAGVLVPAAP